MSRIDLPPDSRLVKWTVFDPHDADQTFDVETGALLQGALRVTLLLSGGRAVVSDAAGEWGLRDLRTGQVIASSLSSDCFRWFPQPAVLRDSVVCAAKGADPSRGVQVAGLGGRTGQAFPAVLGKLDIHSNVEIVAVPGAVVVAAMFETDRTSTRVVGFR